MEVARDFLRHLIDRNAPRDNHAWKLELHMSVEHARLFYVAEKQLEIYEIIGIGIELTDFTLPYCRRRLQELIEEIKPQAASDDIVVMLSARDLNILRDVELHLDRFYIVSKFPERPKGKRK